MYWILSLMDSEYKKRKGENEMPNSIIAYNSNTISSTEKVIRAAFAGILTEAQKLDDIYESQGVDNLGQYAEKFTTVGLEANKDGFKAANSGDSLADTLKDILVKFDLYDNTMSGRLNLKA